MRPPPPTVREGYAYFKVGSAFEITLDFGIGSRFLASKTCNEWIWGCEIRRGFPDFGRLQKNIRFHKTFFQKPLAFFGKMCYNI